MTSNQAPRMIQVQTCEICGRKFIAGYGYSICANWLVTGSAFVRAYLCDQTEHNAQPDPEAPQHSGQHWGCTPEHAVEALQKCLSSKAHMHPDGLRARHTVRHARTRMVTNPDGSLQKDEQGNQVFEEYQRPRYSDEDAHWAEKRYQDKGEDFHILDNFEL